MTEVVKQLSLAEQAALSAQADRIAAAPRPTLDTASGRQFVFLAHFDGTNNDKDNLALSGSHYTTNVAQLHEQMLGQSKSSANFESRYYKGVGTDPGLEGALEASIRPSADMRETALKAYLHFQKEATTWLKNHPEANAAESLQVMATGFSRGASTAAVFSQMLHGRGLADPATGKVLIPPGQLGLAGAVVFDPVTTGFDRNSAFSPESKNITVVQAQHEYRSPFKGVDHSGHPHVSVVPVAGNHCDIGGGYDNGIAARVLEASTAWMKKAGVPVAEVPPERRHDGTAVVHHERDLPKTTEAAQAARSPWLRGAFPIGSRVAEGLAHAADYPLTHDPKNGLDAPRQRVQSATEETRLASGWRRFEAAEGTVWRKAFPGPQGATVRASLVEPHLKPGVDQRRLELQLQSVRPDGSTTQHPPIKADGQDPGATMRALDEKLSPWRTRAAAPQIEVPDRSSTPVPANPMTPLHPALQSLQTRLSARGYTAEQAQTISHYAQARLDPHEAARLTHAALSKDGQSLALVFREPPYKDMAIREALDDPRGIRVGAAAHAPQMAPGLSTAAPVVAEAAATSGYAR